MITLVAVAVALADGPAALYPPPALPEPTAGECPDVVGVDAGDRIPHQLAWQGKARCGFVALPVSYDAHLEETSAWAQLCADRYALTSAYYSGEVARLTLALAATQHDLQRATAWHRRPWLNRAIGAGSVLLVVGAVGYGAIAL